MNDKTNRKEDNKAFKLVMKWSGALLTIAILFGFMHRLINPVENHMDESDYINKIFVENETHAWDQTQRDSTLVGSYDAGSILYVIDERDDFLMVRPFVVSKVDCVWIARENVTQFTQSGYERWLYEEERRKFGFE